MLYHISIIANSCTHAGSRLPLTDITSNRKSDHLEVRYEAQEKLSVETDFSSDHVTQLPTPTVIAKPGSITLVPVPQTPQNEIYYKFSTIRDDGL